MKKMFHPSSSPRDSVDAVGADRVAAENLVALLGGKFRCLFSDGFRPLSIPTAVPETGPNFTLSAPKISKLAWK